MSEKKPFKRVDFSDLLDNSSHDTYYEDILSMGKEAMKVARKKSRDRASDIFSKITPVLGGYVNECVESSKGLGEGETSLVTLVYSRPLPKSTGRYEHITIALYTVPSISSALFYMLSNNGDGVMHRFESRLVLSARNVWSGEYKDTAKAVRIPGDITKYTTFRIEDGKTISHIQLPLSKTGMKYLAVIPTCVNVKDGKQCGTPSLKRCGTCRSYIYCTSECLEADRPLHKKICSDVTGALLSDMTYSYWMGFDRYLRGGEKVMEKVTTRACQQRNDQYEIGWNAAATYLKNKGVKPPTIT